MRMGGPREAVWHGIIRKNYGATHFILFTGLSGSGKTTVANALQERLMELQDRPVTVLDGDLVRQLLSSGLGFSTEDRMLNIKRIGYVASLIVKSGGAVIAAPIAPHARARDDFRRFIE